MVTRLNDFIALVEVGLSRVYQMELKTHPVLYRDWLRERKAKEWIEDELLVTGFGTMPQKAQGGPFIVDTPFIAPEKNHTLVTYGLAFVAEEELFRWDRYSVFKGITEKMARSGVDRKNMLAYSILNNGFSTADPIYTIYNNEAIFDDTHVLLRGGTGKNAPTTAIALTYIGMQEALTDFATTEDEDGLFVVLKARRVICHPAKQWVADTLIRSDYRSDNANMALNTLSGKGLSIHGDSPYLTSQDAWFLTAEKEQMFVSFTIGDDLEFRTDYQLSTYNKTWSMYGSFRVEVYTWLGLWGTAGV